MAVPRPIGWWRVDCLSQSLRCGRTGPTSASPRRVLSYRVCAEKDDSLRRRVPSSRIPTLLSPEQQREALLQPPLQAQASGSR
ncbi:hypothetical protein NDU88_006683 [Pleurodeles waltl]|uniref:Uncharacterized protein n=1 Tax=Pleurodeles waltl TaxID=8319 RepID=A0AAV7WYA0_PLEWA|nr:hypothetical protein NDU88_006683 [Pleurodeles waltl]